MIRTVGRIGMMRTNMVPRAWMSSGASTEFDRFVTTAMENSGLADFSTTTLEQLKQAQVVNTSILFKLTDPDFTAAGLSVGAARALKEAIASAKREKIVERAGERAEIRRSLSMKEKRGF